MRLDLQQWQEVEVCVQASFLFFRVSLVAEEEMLMPLKGEQEEVAVEPFLVPKSSSPCPCHFHSNSPLFRQWHWQYPKDPFFWAEEVVFPQTDFSRPGQHKEAAEEARPLLPKLFQRFLCERMPRGYRLTVGG